MSPHNFNHQSMKLLLTLLAFSLSGCVTPMMTRHDVRIETNPPGAEVTFTKGNFAPVVACTSTPCVYDVRDYFGFWSAYTFTARLAGYPETSVSFEETTPLHAQGIVPAVVLIELTR